MKVRLKVDRSDLYCSDSESLRVAVAQHLREKLMQICLTLDLIKLLCLTMRRCQTSTQPISKKMTIRLRAPVDIDDPKYRGKVVSSKTIFEM